MIFGRSNCLFWALGRWRRFGGYLVVRRSQWGPFPHFAWSETLQTFKSFEPLHPRRRRLPPLIFRGRVRTTRQPP